MEIKRIILLSSLFICCVAMGSQQNVNNADVDAIKIEMNKIKTNDAYIAAESTDMDQEEAFDNALFNVVNSINDELVIKGLPSVTKEDIRPFVHSLSINRGSMKRVLVYIVWAEFIDEPKHPYGGGSGKDDHNTGDGDGEPIGTPTDGPGSSYGLGIYSGEVLASLCFTEMIEDALLQLASFKVEKKISSYGGPCDINYQLQGNTFYLLTDSTRMIRGILEVNNDGTLRNVKTHDIDSIDNYSNCYAFWFNF